MATESLVVTPKSRFHPDPELSATLPGYYYHDADIYEHEKQEIWFKTWQFAGYISDLQDPGDYITADLLDQKILVSRGKDGTLRAFYNVCMHRGHILAEGKGNKSIFTCPFHAWSYDTTGALKAAGNAENVAGFRLEDFTLSEVRVEQLGHMVFVNLSPEGPALSDICGDIVSEFRATVPRYDDLYNYRRDRYDVKANWKLAFDQMECYHCPVLHPQIMGKDAYLEPSFEITAHEFWSTHLTRGNKKVISGEKGDLPYDFGPDEEINNSAIWWIWPNLIFVAHRGPSNLKTMHIVPDGPERFIMHIDNFLADDPPQEKSLSNINYNRDVLQPQDLGAMAQQQLGLHARGYFQGRLMVDKERTWRSEHGTHHFDRLVWEAINGSNYETA